VLTDPKLKLPPFRKIVFIACHAAEPDKEAFWNPLKRSINMTDKPTAIEGNLWVHGLETKQLSFITEFACNYAEKLNDPQKVFVAGWDCAVSIAETSKEDMPKGLKKEDTGRKIINRTGGWKIPAKKDHFDRKQMFCWAVKSGEEHRSTVSVVERAGWSDKA
jgi:hypothetical protein